MKKNYLRTALLSMFAAAALTACSSEETPNGEVGGAPKVKAQFSEATEASWDHLLLLINMDDLSEEPMTSTDKAATFSVEKGTNYLMRASAIEDKEKLELTLESPIIKIKDLSNGVPQMLFGQSEEFSADASKSIPITLKRAVSKVAFSLTAPDEVTGISVKMNSLNDLLSIEELPFTASASAEGLSKTIALTKSEGKFIGSAVLLPSTATNFDLEYTITLAAGDPIVVKTTPAPTAGGDILKANQESIVTGAITGLTPSAINVTAAITYEAWGTSVSVTDDIDLTPAPAGPTAIALNAAMVSTNNPMQYVTYNYTLQGDWDGANELITEEQSAERKAKWALEANLFDNDAATCFHTNFDIYEEGWSWAYRSDALVDYNYIQIDLGEGNTIGKFDLQVQNPDKGDALSATGNGGGVTISVSADGATFTNLIDSKEALVNEGVGAINKWEGLNADGAAIRYIRIAPKDGASTAGSYWPRAAGMFGIAELTIWKY